MLVEDRIKENIATLRLINEKMDEYARQKEILVNETSLLVNQKDCGSKTYNFGRDKFTITSGYNYKLDIDRYIDIHNVAPEICTFVKQEVKYVLDEKKISQLENSNYVADRKIVNMLITKKPKKVHIKLHDLKEEEVNKINVEELIKELCNNGELF
jgi:hypothetical protein